MAIIYHPHRVIRKIKRKMTAKCQGKHGCTYLWFSGKKKKVIPIFKPIRGKEGRKYALICSNQVHLISFRGTREVFIMYQQTVYSNIFQIPPPSKTQKNPSFVAYKNITRIKLAMFKNTMKREIMTQTFNSVSKSWDAKKHFAWLLPHKAPTFLRICFQSHIKNGTSSA